MIRIALTLVTAIAASSLTLGGCNAPQEAAAAPAMVLPTLAAGEFKVDPGHSSAVYKINHLGVSSHYGRFNVISGQYSLNPEDPSLSRISIEIETDSIDSNGANRDGHLKGPDFFDVTKFPTLTFTATGLSETDSGREVTGDLTMVGVTMPVTAKFRWIGDGPTPFGDYRSGFETILILNRTDYGMDTYVKEGMLGDEVQIIIAIEGIREN